MTSVTRGSNGFLGNGWNLADYYWRELFIHSRFLLCHIPQHYIFIPFCLVYLAVESVWKHSHISLLPISTDRQSGLSTSYLRMKRKKNFTTFLLLLLSSIQFFFLWSVIARGARFVRSWWRRFERWTCHHSPRLDGAHTMTIFFFCIRFLLCDSRPLLLGHAREWLGIWWIICNDDLPTSLHLCRCQLGIRGIVESASRKRLMGCTHCQRESA